jgi:predicted transcriptional regulator
MKTTIELPDELFREAKVIAARRRTTLKRLFTDALRKEIESRYPEPGDEGLHCYETGAHGLPVLKRKGTESVTSETIYRIMEEEGI